MGSTRVALVGDYNPAVTAHQAIPRALELASRACDGAVEGVWIGTDTIGNDVARQLSTYDAVWCVPGSPYVSLDGALQAIRFARETGRPFLGTCGGFQHAVLEYARNVLGFKDAHHAELSPNAEVQVITPLACGLVERSGRVILETGSRLETIYGAREIEETYHCNYGLNPQFEARLNGTELRVCGRDKEGEVRAVELTTHPFFICTLFQPERAALKGKAHPLIDAFIAAAVNQD